MKKIISMLIATMLIATGCTARQETGTDRVFNVATLSGPTAMGFVHQMEDSIHEFEILGTPDEAVAKIVNGEVDIAAVPANLAATLYNKTEGDIVVLAVNTLGVLYVVEAGDTVHSMEDLEGKTIYSTGKGATPEYSFNHILNQADVEATVEFKTQHQELATMLAEGTANLAILPQPFVSIAMTANENLRIALDLTEEWNTYDDKGQMVTGVLVAQRSVVEEYKKEVDAFLKEYKSSVASTNKEIDQTADLIVKQKIIPSVEIAKMAIPHSNIVYIDGSDMKETLQNYFNILAESNIKSIGGKLPNEDFYYHK